MNLKQYNFKEETFRHDFKKEQLQDTLKLIQQNQSFTFVSLSGIGVSAFLKFLVSQHQSCFIYIDIDHLPQISKEDFYKLILKQLQVDSLETEPAVFLEKVTKKVQEVLEKNEKLTFIFNHFDTLQRNIDQELFERLRNIKSISKGKISYIFSAHKPIHELIPESFLANNLTLLSKIVYFKPYNQKDLTEMAEKLLGEDPQEEKIQKYIQLSGGSFLLLILLLKTQKENPSLDPFIKFYLREIYDSLSYKQKLEVKKVALGEILSEVDSYLKDSGLVDENGQLFTPLMADFIKANTPLKLSAGETKLFAYLKKNLGKVVTKDEIFSKVWTDESSDWALNSMIYRIRNNPLFKEQGYAIESYKKIGYKLIKN